MDVGLVTVMSTQVLAWMRQLPTNVEATKNDDFLKEG
jgi:hypothetical protein